jgi:hypothetical protein
VRLAQHILLTQTIILLIVRVEHSP